ncbi:hypothetical protein [Streptomyces sp. NPDC046887]|uniref:hypothetical protein n=1 Tax=Streptomyces sp. NPDC046887 TaxID=3155472 RepID=UPI0033CAEFE6
MAGRYRLVARKVTMRTAVAVLALLMSACGESGGSDGAPEAPRQTNTGNSVPSGQPTPEKPDDAAPPDTSRTLASIEGANGFSVTLHTAQRDAGGFLTVTGTLKNTTSEDLIAPINWSGEEVDVKKTGPSLAGATLVDKTEKKRYYVLRDTEGYPLTTTGISAVRPGESVSIFAQFPAPPASTTQVDFQMPLMPPATIELS